MSHTVLTTMGEAAKQAAAQLRLVSTEQKNQALLAIATAINENRNSIQAANQRDVTQAAGRPSAFVDRLLLDEQRIVAMAEGLVAIAALTDPVGTVLAEWQQPNGLHIKRVRVPLGVLGVIYESRPNVTADAAGLALKSGNAVILRGGSESFNSAQAIMQCIEQGLQQAGLPTQAVQMLPDTDRALVAEMLKMDEYIDVLIPRGGLSLIQRVAAESRIPLLKHLQGLCHTYIHSKADPRTACKVVVNAKMRRTGICGATETILVDKAVVTTHMPDIIHTLQAQHCELRVDEVLQQQFPDLMMATDTDWDTEYLDAIVSIKTVSGVDAAIAHIQQHGSHHTDAIITEDAVVAQQFLQAVDSAIVMHNVSTQFADGGEFGMGAEIGIATGKLHARGPVGVEQLTTFKYLVSGAGLIRA